MKKVLLGVLMIAALGITSCTTVQKTATVETVDTEIRSYNMADLEIAPQKATITYKTSRKERKGGNQNCINCAVAELLKANGNADVLVAPQYETKKKRGSIREVKVTGYPSYYKNFRPAVCPNKK